MTILGEDGDVDYRGYTVAELHEALDAIDRNQYPLNFRRLMQEFEARKLDPEARPPEPPKPPPPQTSTESLAFGSLWSVVLLVIASVGLYRHGGFSIGTRSGAQYLTGTDAWVFLALMVVAVPTNLVRLHEWLRDGDGHSETYRLADTISKTAVYCFVAYMVVRVLEGIV